MKSVKHISFDLWLTLIRSEPTFKKRRANFFKQHFDLKNYSVEEIDAVFRFQDHAFNRLSEITGRSWQAEEMYGLVLHQLGVDLGPLSINDLTAIKKECNALFYQYPPQLYAPETKKILTKIVESQQFTLNISSNTGFIEGNILRPILADLDILSCFQFHVFSDEIGYSKPSPLFFDHVFTQIQPLYGGQIQRNQVLHVGDNAESDVWGGQDFGFQTLQINHQSNSTIGHVWTWLHQK
jgi:putative hydrolase of the HAD superfamily